MESANNDMRRDIQTPEAGANSKVFFLHFHEDVVSELSRKSTVSTLSAPEDSVVGHTDPLLQHPVVQLPAFTLLRGVELWLHVF
jgi:hypothetical protein